MESEKSGVGANVISLPEGGGAMKGMGETFSADLFSGTGNYSIPIAVPKGRHGMEPQLSLGYSTGNGNGVCGQGWNMSLPGVMRKTSLGIPQYRDEEDIFVLSGAEDLIPVEKLTEDDNGTLVFKTRYRPRTEGLFAKIYHVKSDDGRDYWEVKTKDGKTSYYGNPDPEDANSCRTTDPENRLHIFHWGIYQTIDPMGNEVIYSYSELPAVQGDFAYSQLYLDTIQYGDYEEDGTKKHLCSVKLNYADRPDVFSRFNSGFEVRTTRRLTNVETYTHPLGRDLPIGYTPESLEWTAEAASQQSDWSAIAYGNGVYVALSSGGANQFMRSTDGGRTWATVASPSNEQYLGIAYGDGVFIAISRFGQDRIFRSVDDGLTWTTVSTSEENEHRGITYGNGVFVIVSYDGTNRVARSEDGGLSWTFHSIPVNANWQSVAFGNGVFVAVAVVGTGTNLVARSTDLGVTWTGAAAAFALNWRSISYGNGVFVAISNSGTNRVMRSMDSGETWVGASTNLEGNDCRNVTYGRGLFVALALSGTNRIAISKDNGDTWEMEASPENNDWTGVAFGLHEFVGVSVNGTNQVMVAPILGQEVLVKRYQLTYRDETPQGALSNGVSQLAKVQMEGHGPDGFETMPPVEFSYTEFDGSSRELVKLNERHLPALSLSDPSMNLVDLDGNGLPDFVEMRPGTPIRYWKNRGRGKFDRPRLMNEAPLALSVEAGAAQIMDADGDGRADLVINTPREKGYYSLRFDGEWDGERYTRYDHVPTVDFSSNDLKYMDLTGDGRTDLIVNSDRAFDCYFQNSPLIGEVGTSETSAAKPGWSDRVRVRKQTIEDFPDVNFSDPRIRTADLSGDGLQDIVMITSGGVFYWPNLGYGNFGGRRLMKNSPRPGFGFDPDRVLLADINGDGLTDYVYINVNSVDYYINQSGKAWGEKQTVKGTPRFTSRNAIHVVDLMGTGTAGLLWSYNAGESRDRMYFLDLTKGQKPYLLNEVKNNLGAVTRVEYTPSTEFYLRDYYGDYSSEFNFVDPVGKWKTTLPFPTLTVSKVEAIDLISKNKLTTRYFYHHGYWDGVEREFRGFGRVDQFDTETFDGYNAQGLLLNEDFTGITTEEYSPPVYTKNWFHLGPVEKVDGDWGETEFADEYWQEDQQLINRPADFFDVINGLNRRAKRDAYRTLRGTALRSELFAKDGSPYRDRPYSVKETQNTIKLVDSPELNDIISQYRTLRHSNYIFFPYQYGGRETAWERGTEPKTSFSFTGELDDYGQPLSNLSIAVPRGKNPLSGAALPGADAGAASADYHVVLSTMGYITPPNETPYIVDRVKETKSEEITATANFGVFAIREGAFAGSGIKRTLSHQLNYYDGQAFEGEAFGSIGNFGLLVKSENLVITPTEITDIYDTAPPCFNEGNPPNWQGYPSGWSNNLPDEELGYLYHDGNTAPHLEGYYAEGERLKYDIQDGTAANRGNVLAMRDTYDRETTIEYDGYDLMAVKVTDPLGMEVSALNDYRLLAPLEMTDPNENRTRVGYNELGLVAKMYLLGKAGASEGDVYDSSGTNDSPSQTFEYFFNDYLNSERPISVLKTVREHHEQRDYTPTNAGATIKSVEFSDGYGRIVQSRTQAENLLYGDSFLGDSGLSSDMSATVGNAIGTERTSGALNVVVSGKKRYNNKGEVVEQYEPFFSTSFNFAEETTQPGVTIKMYYDALGRLVKTKNPDDSEQRVYFGTMPTVDDLDSYTPTPWERFTYDANDLAGITHPTDGYPSSHYYTPKSELIDALGRVIETTEHQAHYDAANQVYEDVVMKYQYDIKGQLTQVTNANNVVQTVNKFDTAGNQLYTDHIDRGVARLTVDTKGMPYVTTDAKEAATLSLYDNLDRPTKMWARDKGTESLAVRNQTIYGDAAGLTDPEDQNLKGKPYQVYDGAGRLTFDEYDFKGNLLEKTRRVVKDTLLIGQSKFELTWGTLDTSKLDGTNFKTNTVYDALNRAIEVTYPQDKSGGRKKLHPEYNKAGALEKLKFGGATAVSQIAYNAKGQRTMMVAAGLMTRYAYDEDTFRLTRIRAEKFSKSGNNYGPKATPNVRLDRGYSYDLMGSVTGVHDKTPGNSASQGPNDQQWVYDHDPLRRLISATGREHSSAFAAPPWDTDVRTEDHTAANTYTRKYEYDKQGNILELDHKADGVTGQDFTRTYNYGTGALSNRLQSFDVSSNNYSYAYDANGNLVQENTDRYFEWNYADKLAFFKRQAGTGNPTIWVHYVYDNEGNRVKKFVNKAGNIREVTVYIDGIYEYSYQIVGTTVQSNYDFNTLHIMDGSSRIATVRVGSHTADLSPAQKYFVEDHLGNASVVVKTNGDKVNLEEYYPFGETAFGSFQYKRYRYNGKEKDEHTGLYEYGQRYYAPWLCRFVSVDPIAEDFPHLSSYNYASNRPVTAKDLEGLQADNESSDTPSQSNTYSPRNTCTTCPTNADPGQVHFSTDIKPFNAPNNQMLSGTDGKGLSTFMSDNLSSIAWVNFGGEAGWQAMSFKTEAGELFTWSSDANWYVNDSGQEFDDHLSFDIVNMVGGSVGMVTQAYIDQIETGDALSTIKSALSEYDGSTADFILDGFKQTISDITSGGHSRSQALGSMYMGFLSGGGKALPNLTSKSLNLTPFKGYGLFGEKGLKIGNYKLEAFYENPNAVGGTFFSLKQMKEDGALFRLDYGKIHKSDKLGMHSTVRFYIGGKKYGSSAQREWYPSSFRAPFFKNID